MKIYSWGRVVFGLFFLAASAAEIATMIIERRVRWWLLAGGCAYALAGAEKIKLALQADAPPPRWAPIGMPGWQRERHGDFEVSGPADYDEQAWSQARRERQGRGSTGTTGDG